jgi:ribonuclease HII
MENSEELQLTCQRARPSKIMMQHFDQMQLSKMTIKEIDHWISQISENELSQILTCLEKDPRKGVQALVKKKRRQVQRTIANLEKIHQKKQLEDELMSQGFQFIAGIDEVGRGPLAGPVVAAAVIMPKESCILGMEDSKKLSEKTREKLNLKIRKEAIAIGIGQVEPQIIDQINILEATKLAMNNAVEQLHPSPDLLLIDAVQLPSDIPVKAMIHGDERCYSIGAASIVAKVYRDNLMKEYAKQFPQYGFESNKGYGSAEHIAAIRRFGATPIHRKTFIKNFV